MGCTPICINGVIDQAVVNFSAGLIDILMELAFGEAPPGDRWRDCGDRLVMLARTLKESAPPSWVTPPAREHGDLHSLVNANLLLSMGSDCEDETRSFPSLPLGSSSLRSPSTSTSAITPRGQVAATASPLSHQGPPASDMATAAQIPQLQGELHKTRRSVKTLTITECMFPAVSLSGMVSNPVFVDHLLATSTLKPMAMPTPLNRCPNGQRPPWLMRSCPPQPTPSLISSPVRPPCHPLDPQNCPSPPSPRASPRRPR